MKKYLSRFTGSFQYVAGAMMIPIIVLVVCGLLMGFASPFVNYIFTAGTIPHTIALMFMKIASMIMGNLPLWFVAGISFGLSKNNKGYAAFAGVFMLMCVNTIISVNAGAHGYTPDTVVPEALMKMGMTSDAAIVFSKLWTNVLGVFTYDMSIFGAIICGATTGILMNKWGDIKLPNLFSFFAGPKFIILIIPFFAALEGTIIYYVWPVINDVIQYVAVFIGKSGLVGTFVYGVVDRALLPFGMHHLVTFPLQYTELGGKMLVDGQMILGTKNIENAVIGSATATHYLVRNFTSGRIVMNLGAWPGAAVAMYFCAKKENRKKALAILVPAVFTASVVGVTEPMEFTVLFANPLLYYLVHVPMTGLAFVLTEATKVSIQGFALIFMIPNVLQPAKVHAMSLLVLIPLYFALYFIIFRWAILKWDIKTPGRGTDKLISKKEFQQKAGLLDDVTKQNSTEDDFIAGIVESFGGAANMLNVENCATRLRVEVKDTKLVADKQFWLENREAIGVVVNGSKYQIIYGPRVTNICSQVKQYLEKNANK